MIRLILLVLAATAACYSLPPTAARAYSYAASGAEPLLDARAALFDAVAKGDWTAAAAAVKQMQADLDYLDQNEDKGIAHDFDAALAAKDAKAIRSVWIRAAKDEILRRLDGARQNLSNYQSAKVLVITANRFFTAVSPDLDPAVAQKVGAQMKAAIAAVGNPGVFGVGATKPDPKAFDAARTEVLTALGKEK